MAQEQTPIFSFDNLEVTQDAETKALQVTDTTIDMTATLPVDDPLHKRVLEIMSSKNAAKGFMAHEIYYYVNKEDRFQPIDRKSVKEKSHGVDTEVETAASPQLQESEQVINPAQEQTPIFTYGPMEIVQDPETQALQVSHTDLGETATLPVDDPMHKQVLDTIGKNPYSKGFVANHIHALMENEGHFLSPELDGDGIVFGPSVENVVEKKSPGMEVSEIDLNSPEGKALMEEVREMSARLKNPVEYDPASPEIPVVAQDANRVMQEVGPQAGMDLSAIRARLMNKQEYQPEKYHEGVPEVGTTASAQIQELVAERERTRPAQETEVPPPEKQDQAVEADQETKKALENWTDTRLADLPGTGGSGNDKSPTAQDQKPKFERKLPPVVLLGEQKKAHVLDYGDKITVTNRAMMGMGSGAKEKKRQAVEVALAAAAKRFGEPVHFQGNEKFMRETIAVAIERGIKLEPGTEAAKRMYERELAKIEPNQLGAAKGVPNRAPEKTKTVDKGLGL
ncbi:hypothetical protein HHS34_005615 [Acidithiobacillus montserratensis]|uniref:Uncharacterized protein n=1 Tax=Acidithiobacillus montserratensis TaxID=2729135 RepID=A0ACD5HL49_9PROT|nr:LPD7 domain-containing protein [Acidithiobacillus montserratensis]MBU2747845.1 hypothetical protein [Acidithiobacillus montserratensis]